MPRYAFFDTAIRQQFADAVSARDIPVELEEIADEFLVLVPHDLNANSIEMLDEIYNDIMAAGMGMWEETDAEAADSAAAVKVQLASGEVANIRFNPDLLARLLEVLTPQEIEDMVQAIALGVENPTDAPICVQRDNA